ncbi:NUDIX domain-containing protein [Desulfotalea psychrophila]|uniref:Related to ADP-ribose pyrophosphatase n=1 Tax=Desulfotalea psychrophila (strain LSv54 / DSM 12343) TaxID=177439 RepID=Q6AS73_DESPS|nr:NUDIX hydrolase [Desulfotalea psychrophila]CAG34802.1 related to ADP-ribose pyrophosphatase [Desulfotalea psychrophila LSv54]
MKCPHCQGPITIYRNPIPTVDIIIEIEEKVVLIERKNTPHGWAIPGGFVDYGESFETAALREAEEETGIKLKEIEQFRTYSAPDRDPRQHTASTVFFARGDGQQPRGGDDALRAELFSWDDLPAGIVFDHKKILAEFRAFSQNLRT